MSPRGTGARSSGGRLQAGRTGLEAQATSGRLEGPARKPPTKRQLEAIYEALLDHHGHQQWWPTASEDPEEQRFEICLGAILTQNTSWRGAAAALANLRAEGLTDAASILDTPLDVLGELVRPSGHFNVKARKLHAFCEAVMFDGGGSVDALLEGDAGEVRSRLLEIWGIGPETADAMTLYAARKPTFVVDAYAYRIFERLGCPPGPRRYDVYREFLLSRLVAMRGPDVSFLNEWHALLVRHGQQICTKSRPRCEACPLLRRCDFGRSELRG
ncbi:MAG: endonuclease III domain-containing protein [Dehalococcoidia bacterium]|nr:endonuclease III domain-containing protein [Dehalococcoidia bacterium]